MDPQVCSLDYRLKIIGRLPFFRDLSHNDIVSINRLFDDRDVAAGGAIYFEGDSAQHLFLVALGKVKLIRHTATGHDVLLDILIGGEYFGNLSTISGKMYTESAVAQTDSCILQISAANFEKILQQHPHVTLKVLNAVNRRLEASQEVVKQLSAYSVEQRIAATLVRLAEKMGAQHDRSVLIQLPFSRQDLAAMTGTTVETVSRVMSRFAEGGLISTGRRWVAIDDLEGLRHIQKEAALN